MSVLKQLFFVCGILLLSFSSYAQPTSIGGIKIDFKNPKQVMLPCSIGFKSQNLIDFEVLRTDFYAC